MLPSKDTMDFIISGFGMNTAMISKFDAVGVFMTLDGFEQLYEAAEGDEPADSDFVYYVRFRENCNIRKSIQNMKEQYHLTDENIGQNTALLGIMGFSDDSYMLGLYGTAGVLFLLVLTAGILMIASSMNSNIAERTEFLACSAVLEPAENRSCASCGLRLCIGVKSNSSGCCSRCCHYLGSLCGSAFAECELLFGFAGVWYKLAGNCFGSGCWPADRSSGGTGACKKGGKSLSVGCSFGKRGDFSE